MRGLDKANSTGQRYFVTSLLDSLRQNDLTSRSLVAELGDRMDVTNMTLEQEAEFWDFDLSGLRRGDETEEERYRRYYGSTLSEVPSPDYWTEVQGYHPDDSGGEDHQHGGEVQEDSDSGSGVSGPEGEDAEERALVREAPVLPIDDYDGRVLVPRFFLR